MKVTKNINMQNNCVRVYMNISIYVFPHAHTMFRMLQLIIFDRRGERRVRKNILTGQTKTIMLLFLNKYEKYIHNKNEGTI